MLVALPILLHIMKYIILKNLSTTTKIEPPFFYLGKPKTNSKKISTQGSLGTSKGIYKPRGKTLDLMHLSRTLCTPCFILG
jgi:hypothetical protein